MAEPKVTLGVEELKDVLTTVLAEARKPVVTEQQQREIAEQQEARARGAEQAEELRKTEEWNQAHCSHRRRDNSPRTVHVNNNPKSGGEFLICQACQKIIRPEEEPDLFNSLLVDQSPVIW